MTSRIDFRLSAIIGDGYPEIEMPPVEDLLSKLRNGEVAGEAVIYPLDADFPRLMIDWHSEQGFVLLCFDGDTSIGDFLIRGPVTSAPSVPIVLGGQALEKWPPELFVPTELAADALGFFIDTGRRKSDLFWARIDAFPREVVWEGRDARRAWEEREHHGDV
jgi:hypothetical protein